MFDDKDDNYKSHEEIEKMPVYKKAWEIMQLGRKIADAISTDDLDTDDDFKKSMLDDNVSYIRQNSSLLPVKIAGAEGGDLYDIRMENASIIRKAARELLTDSTGLKIAGYPHLDYLQLLRDEVEEFRVLFAEWVKAFDQENYIIDRWGLFNPPGVNYDDYDPDDDIPLDLPDDFFD